MITEGATIVTMTLSRLLRILQLLMAIHAQQARMSSGTLLLRKRKMTATQAWVSPKHYVDLLQALWLLEAHRDHCTTFHEGDVLH